MVAVHPDAFEAGGGDHHGALSLLFIDGIECEHQPVVLVAVHLIEKDRLHVVFGRELREDDTRFFIESALPEDARGGPHGEVNELHRTVGRGMQGHVLVVIMLFLVVSETVGEQEDVHRLADAFLLAQLLGRHRGEQRYLLRELIQRAQLGAEASGDHNLLFIGKMGFELDTGPAVQLVPRPHPPDVHLAAHEIQGLPGEVESGVDVATLEHH